MSEIPPTGPIPPSSSGPVQGTPPSGGPVYSGPTPDQDAKTFGMLAHLLGIFGFVGPLIIWLVKKDTSPFVDDQGKEALNFQLTLVIGWVASILLNLIMCIGVFLWPILIIVGLIFAILGAMKAKEGIPYRYPFNIRFIK